MRAFSEEFQNMSYHPKIADTPRERRIYAAPKIERVSIACTETGIPNPTEFSNIIGPTS